MRRAAILLASLALAAPALAQQATPSDKPLDWSKPVVGVDGPTQGDRALKLDVDRLLRLPEGVRPEDAPTPVEVYTLEDLKAAGAPSVKDFVNSLTGDGGSAPPRAADPGILACPSSAPESAIGPDGKPCNKAGSGQ